MSVSGPTSVSTEPTAFDVLPEWTDAQADVFDDNDDAERPRSPMRQTLEWGAVIIGALIAALVIKDVPVSGLFHSLSIDDTHPPNWRSCPRQQGLL